MEGFEVAIAALLEKLDICEFYASIYLGVPLSSHPQLQSKLESALPELYAAVIVFAVKARAYFKARGKYILCEGYYSAKSKLGIKKIANTLKSFDIEFQPFIEEINAKEGAIRESADAATMERIKSMVLHIEYNGANLMKVYRHGMYP